MLTQIGFQIESSTTKLSELTSQIGKAKAELESLQTQCAQKDTMVSELTKTRSQIDSAKTKLADLNFQIDEAKNDLNSLRIQYIRRQDIVLAKKELESVGKESSLISQKGHPVTKSNEVLYRETKEEIKKMDKRRSEFFSYLAEER